MIKRKCQGYLVIKSETGKSSEPGDVVFKKKVYLDQAEVVERQVVRK